MSLITNFWQYVAQKIRPYADVDMNGKKISGLPTTDYPTADGDGATKKYVDDNADGVSDHAELTNVLPNQHHTKFTTTEHDITTRHPVSVLKRSNGSASGTVGTSLINLNMHRYSFFPNINTNTGAGMYDPYNNTGLQNDTIGRFGIKRGSGSTTYDIRWDYLSSSGPPVIWIIADKEGHLIHCWQADDISDVDNPDKSPIELPEMPMDWHNLRIDIPSNFKEIKKSARAKKKSLSEYILGQYTVNLKTNRLNKKKE